MAKSRARARRAGARKTARRARKHAMPRKLRRVDLKPIYNQAKTAVLQLRRFERRREIARAIARLNRCMKEISAACPSNMIILEPRKDL